MDQNPRLNPLPILLDFEEAIWVQIVQQRLFINTECIALTVRQCSLSFTSVTNLAGSVCLSQLCLALTCASTGRAQWKVEEHGRRLQKQPGPSKENVFSRSLVLLTFVQLAALGSSPSIVTRSFSRLVSW